MPSHYTHYFFGRQVLAALPPSLREETAAHADAYSAGLQGPDLFFYYHPLRKNPVRREGVAIHHRSGLKFFLPAREILEQEDSPDRRSYIAGFLCHYMLDSICHPVIDGPMARQGLAHFTVEGELDRLCMAEDGRDPIADDPLPWLHPSPRLAQAIAPFYPGISPGAVEEALRGMKRIVPLTRVRSKRALPLLALRLTPFYQAYAGVFLTPVPAAGYGESVHQLREMLDQAVAPTVVQILEFFRGLSTHLPLDSRLNLTFGGTEDE